MSNVISYLPFIIILLAMVVIHEFGHFIVAKMLGIAVETFSVGFGTKLLGFKYGETTYQLSAIPLGGYVKFRGENMEMIQGKSEGSIDEFLAHPGWKRLLVAVAGPVFNIATAIIIPAAALLIGYYEKVSLSQQVVVGEIRAGSTAEQAGFRIGDRIVAYGDEANPTWQDLEDYALVRPGETVSLQVEREGKRMTIPVRVESETQRGEQFGFLGLDAAVNGIQVGGVSGDGAAAAAGLRAGDRITLINGETITAIRRFRQRLNESQGQEVALKVERAGSLFDTKVAPRKVGNDFLLGIGINNTVFVKTSSLREALVYGWKFNKRILKLTTEVFRQIFVGKRSASNSVQGPLGMAEATSDTFKTGGWAGVIMLMGLISLNLGVMNLLPIPVLDGGVILLIIVEWLMGLVGMTLSMRWRERIQQVGFAMVLLLMVFAIGNDILRVASRFTSSPPANTQPAQQPAK